MDNETTQARPPEYGGATGSEFPSAAELQIAARVCLLVAFSLSRHIPWWKRWMYDLSHLQTVGEKLSAMSAIVTPNAALTGAESVPSNGEVGDVP